ncbi:MAG: nicotinate-nucleotide--dimethylbenzimidazole phosphoribosyltransferase [Nocardioidaceae bacterium]
MTLDELVQTIRPPDADAANAARERHTRLAKPPGSLGRLEALGTQLAGIAGRCPPPVPSAPVVVVAAGDHGVHARGVSDWPQSVTSAMVATVAGGGAAVNAIAHAVGATVTAVDVGTMGSGTPPPGVRDRRVRAGTRDLTAEPAMTIEECTAAIAVGAEAADEALAAGADLLATGEVGIANTTPSACLIAALTGVAPEAVTGRGANLDDTRTSRKLDAVKSALARHGGDRDPLGVLASLGGLEHAALVGVVLAGAAARAPVVVDGVISGAAALAAVALCPDAAGYLIPGHASAEPGGRALADRLGRPPLIDLELRLGEGTGALLAVPLVRSAAAVLTDMATLDSVVDP